MSYVLNILDVFESKYGAAGILASRGQSAVQRALRAASKATNTSKHLPPNTNLSKMFGINVTAPAPTPQSYKPLPSSPPPKSIPPTPKPKALKTKADPKVRFSHVLKSMGRKALSGHSALGFGAVALAGAINPGLGLVVRGIQQTFGDSLDEAIDWKLPPEPGTVPIPKDHVRLYHQTSEENLGAIKHQGLQFAKAKGYEGPRGIYADEKGFYGKPTDKPTVEFHVHKSRWHPPFVTGDDVKPHEIIAVHKPWHDRARSTESDPRTVKNIVSGKHDNLLNDPYYHHTVSYIKHKYGKA